MLLVLSYILLTDCHQHTIDFIDIISLYYSQIAAMSALKRLSSTSFVKMTASNTLSMSVYAVIPIDLLGTPRVSSKLKASAANIDLTSRLILLACHTSGQHSPLCQPAKPFMPVCSQFHHSCFPMRHQ